MRDRIKHQARKQKERKEPDLKREQEAKKWKGNKGTRLRKQANKESKREREKTNKGTRLIGNKRTANKKPNLEEKRKRELNLLKNENKNKQTRL